MLVSDASIPALYNAYTKPFLTAILNAFDGSRARIGAQVRLLHIYS